MTHVLREVVRTGSRLNKKEALEAVTVVEVPKMMVVGVIGYKETPYGKKAVATVWAGFVAEEVKRRFYKNYYKVKKAQAKGGAKQIRAFSGMKKKIDENTNESKLAKITAEADVVRLIAHTQPKMVDLGSKKADVVEIQINGGTTADKVKFAHDKFEQELAITDVFKTGDVADLVSVGKGRGWEGVVHRYGTKLLQKKTHRGRRKVACIGPWNPRRVSWAVARAGNNGFRKRTELGKRLYRVWTDDLGGSGSTEFDLTKKSINPMGGFVRYGLVRNDFVLVKGSVCGAVKRIITLRKPVSPNKHRIATEEIGLKWIDTSSKFGHGRFQTPDEHRHHLGKLKISKRPAEVPIA